MPVKIRLTRMGKKKQPSYRVVVMDSRKPRDGAYIEQIGRYDPRAEPSIVEIDNDKALHWLNRGAQPTDRAKKLLEISGAWTRFRVAKGDIHTIGDTPTPAAAPAPAPEPVAVDPEPVEAPAPVEPESVVAAAEPVTTEDVATEDVATEEAATEDVVAEVTAEVDTTSGEAEAAAETATEDAGSEEEEQA